MQSLILDVQATARSFGETAQATVERAVASTDRRFSVCPMALAIPTQEPLDSWNATTWPACYVEWWFGDGCPGLERDRPMLLEQVARRHGGVRGSEEMRERRQRWRVGQGAQQPMWCRTKLNIKRCGHRAAIRE